MLYYLVSSHAAPRIGFSNIRRNRKSAALLFFPSFHIWPGLYVPKKKKGRRAGSERSTRSLNWVTIVLSAESNVFLCLLGLLANLSAFLDGGA